MNGQCTKTNDSCFMMNDDEPGSYERILTFSLDEGLVNLSEIDTWFCDGNFKLNPNFFLQLYVIIIKKYE